MSERRRWQPGVDDPFAAPPEGGWLIALASDWSIGDLAYMVNCYGRDKIEGEVVEHFTYSVTIRQKSGQLVSGSTSLLLPPTGQKWPYQTVKPKEAKPQSAPKKSAKQDFFDRQGDLFG